MYYSSTRDTKLHKTLSEAMSLGLAPDGGLFVPEYFPRIRLDELASDLSYPDFAKIILKEYFEGDVLAKSLSDICDKAFTFPLPLSQVNSNTFQLELFHGPTLSFKDVGARFLAESLACLPHPEMTILVATSGDTGSAVAAAFYLKPKIKVIVLYPKGKISERQEHQIACWGHNVKALAVEGSFDDCQKLVKAAFQAPHLQAEFHLSSANSINIGRLLPQLSYYAYHSWRFMNKYQQAPGFIVPTGNLGHATAAYWAKEMGFPIREILISTNANVVIEEYLNNGQFQPRPSIQTLANAMDVGNPSNFERMQYLFKSLPEFKEQVKAISATDDIIRATIKKVYENEQLLIDPHTATAFYAREQLSEQPWIVVATADAAKFETIIEPLLGMKVPVPDDLQDLLSKPTEIITIHPTLEELKQYL